MLNTDDLGAKRTRFIVVTIMVTLMAELIVWRTRSGLSAGDVVLIAVLTAPFLFALPRLVAGHRRTYAWMTLAVTPFLIVGITEAVANPAERLGAGLCLMFAFLLFVMLIAYLRLTRGHS